MKLETILDAMDVALLRFSESYTWSDHKLFPNSKRQYRAFRTRILRMFEQYEIYHGFHMGDVMMIETITEKDKRIAELEDKLERHTLRGNR